MHFSSGTPPRSPLLLQHTRIPSVLSDIPRTFSRHYFLRGHPSQPIQPFLFHPLIPGGLLPYPAEVPPPLPFRAALSSALHILSRLLHASRHLPHPLQSTRGLPPSSLASNSPPDSFQWMSTYSCPLDNLPKPAEFITIGTTHSLAFRNDNCQLHALRIVAGVITIRAIHSHAFPAHGLPHYYCLTIPDPFSTGNLI